MSYIAVDDADCAGALVYWSLSGYVDLDDMLEVCDAEGIPEGLQPNAPTLEVAAHRAAEKVAREWGGVDGTLMVRSVGRRSGIWDVTLERAGETNGRKANKYTPVVRVEVVEDQVTATPQSQENESQRRMAASIEHATDDFLHVLTAVDVSSWLLLVLRRLVDAVRLRRRGGIYFVPRDKLSLWESVSRIITSCSAHAMHSVPALKTDDAVDAIMAAFRREMSETVKDMEEYLAGEISTKGLNSREAKLVRMQDKAAHYSELLGVSMDDLNAKLTSLGGIISASRIKRAQSDD